MRGYATYDNALPQDFFDEVLNSIKDPNDPLQGHPWAHFVWLFRKENSNELLFGIPAPISVAGENWLRKHKPEIKY